MCRSAGPVVRSALRRAARLAVAARLAGAALLGLCGAARADCAAAAAEAERAWSIPPGLLLAIGRVESGRWDPERSKVVPWPWAVNAGGQGWYFQDAASAAAHVAGLQGQGVRSIDVGCFQVNLLHHPAAFASVAEGFDPARNAEYAARFLASLYLRTGDWPAAVARYHSATPGLSDAYRARVLAAWEGATDKEPAGRIAPAVPRPPALVLAVAGVRVFAPGGYATEPAARPGLPRVFVPGQPASPLRLAGLAGR